MVVPVRLAFRDGVLPEEAAWLAVVLIPKGGGDYRGIGLVEVIWKTVAVILNCHFTATITYHNFLYGLWGATVRGPPPSISRCFSRLQP